MSAIVDPRVYIIKDRIKSVKRIICVTGFKGGIGKSMVSVALSLSLNERGFKTGLLDLDFSGSSDHVIMGIENIFPREEKGLVAPYAHGIKFMTPAFFSKGKAIALRGDAITDSIKEILTVTIWEELDFLILDMPPGINDIAFEVMNFIDNGEILAIEIPSLISRDVLRRCLEIYKDMNFKVIGIVENMANKKNKEYYHQIFYDKNLENSVGSVEKIMKTAFYKDVYSLSGKISRFCSLFKVY